MKKILIVEDEPAYSKLLYDQLALRSYTVINAYNGEEGLIKAREEKPDLLIVDVRMPKMDGLTMLKHLRKSEKGKQPNVIMLSNLEPNAKTVRSVIANQPGYYFVKSDTKLEDLFNKIDELLAK